MGIKDTIAKTLSVTVDLFQDIVLKTVDNRYTVFDNSLAIYGYSEEDNCVYLKPDKKSALYCIEIAQTDNLPTSIHDFTSYLETYGYEDDAKCVLFYTKNPVIIDDSDDTLCTKQSIYLFSYSKPFLEAVSSKLEGVELKPPHGIISSLFDIGLVNSYYNDSDSFKLKSTIDVEQYQQDEMAFLFKTIFAEGVYKAVTDTENLLGVDKKKKFKVYQGLGYRAAFADASKPNVINAFQEDWKGYIAFSIDFNKERVKQSIRTWRDAARTFETDKDIKNGYEEFDSNIFPTESSKYVVENIIAVVDNPFVMNVLGGHLNIKFFEKTVFSKNLIYKTPLETRDTSLDFLTPVSDLNRFVKTLHKRQNIIPKKTRDIYGADISGNYVTYSFSESNSPHFSVVAPTRSGKTFFIMKMISQTLGAKIVRNPAFRNTEENTEPFALVDSCSRLGKNRVVHFDTGYSALKWIKELKKRYPKEVLFYEDNINELRFGLTDIRWNTKMDKPDEEDMTFSLSIMSLLLELNGGEVLTASEKTQVRDAFASLYKKKDFEGLSLRRLTQIGGYDEVLAGIEKQYGKLDELTMLTNIEGLEELYPFLVVPLLDDIRGYLELKSANYIVKQVEKDAAISAASKLSSITSSDIFGYYSKADIKDSFYFYMELETIKTLGESVFVPIFILMFQKLYRRDVKKAQYFKNRGKVPPKVFYIIEESHNFRIPSLLKLFDVVLREAARYNIHVGFITQSGHDLDASLLYNIGTRVVLPSDKPDEQAKELESYWAEGGSRESGSSDNNNKYVKFFKTYNKQYTAFLKYGGGVLTLKPPVSEEEAWIFNSNPTQELAE